MRINDQKKRPIAVLFAAVSILLGATVFPGPASAGFVDAFVSAGSGGLDWPADLVFGPDGNLYVSSRNTNEVLRYDGATGAFLDAFVSAGSGGLSAPIGLVFGPDGNLYVCSQSTDRVLRYDGSTGAFLNIFASGGGLDIPQGLVFGPDGNLYVVCGPFAPPAVKRFNGTTGAFIGTFVTAGSGGLSEPRYLVFGPDGNLYVGHEGGGGANGRVKRYDGATGGFIDDFVPANSGGLPRPRDLVFGPDGNLYVSCGGGANKVARYDGTTGAYIDDFASPASGLVAPEGLVFGADNRLYVSSGTTDEVLRYEGDDPVTPVPDGDCLSITNTCETVPVLFDRTNTSGARAVSATIQLSPELMLCSGLSSIVQGTWLSAFPGQTVFQVVDNGGGSYTVDQSILGNSPLPCGETSGGQLFTIDVKAAGGDGTGTLTVTEVIVRDCANAPLPGNPGAAASITIDTAAPTAVANLSALQVKTGNTAGNDTTGIVVSFTAPGDATVLEIYGAGYGNYPEYNDAPGAGAVPAIPSYPPGTPWVLASTAVSPATVHFADRDFYYLVIFTKDACGNVSPVSNMTTGTLNYHLGDVADGTTNGHGNNSVGTEDISHLGFNYGITLGVSDPLGYLDVGPTSDFSVNALPTTDNQVQFEDLMMFAINFGQVGRIPGTPTEAPIENPQIVLISDGSPSAGNVVAARLVLQDNGHSVKGIHTAVSYDRSRLELVSVIQGALLDEQAAPLFFKDLASENGVVVDAAVLGRELTLAGSGEVATLTFRVLSSGAVPVLGDVALRGRDNQPAGRPVQPVLVESPQDNASIATVALPERLELVGARPNPFQSSTDIVFRIPATSAVSVNVYDVSGRLVRTLVDRTLAPGEHKAAWDGRASDGHAVGSGIYFYTFRTDGHQETRRLIHFR